MKLQTKNTAKKLLQINYCFLAYRQRHEDFSIPRCGNLVWNCIFGQIRFPIGVSVKPKLRNRNKVDDRLTSICAGKIVGRQAPHEVETHECCQLQHL